MLKDVREMFKDENNAMFVGVKPLLVFLIVGIIQIKQ